MRTKSNWSLRATGTRSSGMDPDGSRKLERPVTGGPARATAIEVVRKRRRRRATRAFKGRGATGRSRPCLRARLSVAAPSMKHVTTFSSVCAGTRARSSLPPLLSRAARGGGPGARVAHLERVAARAHLAREHDELDQQLRGAKPRPSARRRFRGDRARAAARRGPVRDDRRRDELVRRGAALVGDLRRPARAGARGRRRDASGARARRRFRESVRGRRATGRLPQWKDATRRASRDLRGMPRPWTWPRSRRGASRRRAPTGACATGPRPPRTRRPSTPCLRGRRTCPCSRSRARARARPRPRPRSTRARDRRDAERSRSTAAASTSAVESSMPARRG